jgi:hypothetical protein
MRKYKITYKQENQCSVLLKREPTEDEFDSIKNDRLDLLSEDLVCFDDGTSEEIDIFDVELHIEEEVKKDNCPQCGSIEYIDVPSWSRKICKNCTKIY